MKKKVLSMLVVFAMVFSMLPATALAVEGEVETINLNEGPCTIEGTGKYAVSKYTGANTLTVKANATITLEGVNITAAPDTSAISIESGSVTLIVDDDSTLIGGDNGAGIYVAEDASVTIRSESNAELTAIGNAGVDDNSGAAGIGGTYANGNSGAITIDGASVVAKGYGVHGSGIGSGSGKVVGKIQIINGANVTAYGGYYADGAGTYLTDWWGSGDPEGGAAIGGGGKTSSTIADIIITDSVVAAYGGSKAAGIGANFWSKVANITIGGNSIITAQGGSCSAGIGASRSSSGNRASTVNNIAITGGTVTAVGGDFGAGIGTGYNSKSRTDMPISSIVISGGTVTATGGMAAAGIGGGYKDGSVNIGITGGKVTAEAGKPIDETILSHPTTWYERTACAIGSGADGDSPADGKYVTTASKVDIKNAGVAVTAYEDGKPAIEGVANDTLEDAYTELKAPRTGTITPAYTGNDGFWGEGTSNAAVSYVVELYEGDTKIASASLNDVDDIINGTVKKVTWSIPFAGSTDEYWTVVWADGYPTATMRPDAVKLIVDGTLVDTNDVQFNAPDDLKKIVASTADSSGALTGYYTTLADALTSAKNGDKIELLWTEGDAPISMAGSVVGNKTVTITGTATVDWTKGDLFIGRGGEGNGKVIFDGANITSSVKKNPASTGIHVSGGKKTDSSVNYGTLEIKNSTIELDYLINRNETVIDGNSTLTVYGGCYTHGRDANESTSGTDETATLTIGAGSTVNVINENGMGVGGEGKGEMTVNGTYTANVLNVSSKGTVNIGGTATALGAITNNGTITLTDAAATLTTTEVADAQKPESGVKYYYVTYANNAYKLVTDYVAEVNGTPYTTLAAAVNVGGEVKLLTDVTENVTIPDGATLTIDLNQKTLNGYVAPCTPASLTIKNGSIVNNESSKSAIEVNAGSLTLTDVNVSSARHAVRIDGAVTATIDGGNYTLIATSGSTQHAVNVSGDAAVTIKDGTFVGPKGTTMDSGAAVNVQAGSAVNIEGGNFTNGKNDTLASKGTLTITGGTFDQDPSAYVAEGYEAVEDSGVWTVQRKTYTITFDVNGGNDSNSTSTTKSDGTVTLPSDPTRSGYTFKGWYTASSGGTKVTASTVFTADTTVYAQWTQNYSGGGGGSYTPGYSITAEDTENGSISLSPKSASSGTTVTITVDPDKGYVLGTLTVLDKNGKEIELTKKADNKYTFKMPASKVTVEASFAKTSSSPVDSFLDVNTGAWYYDAVKYAVENGLMSGTGTYTFEPNTTLSRGMIAQMLYALEGKPSVSSANNFTDVSSSDWYDKAASWAQSKGIITGYEDGRFGPNDPLTREQLALILYNYAKSEGHSTSTKADLSKFADDTSTSPWAQQAMSWAVGEGLLSGRGVNMLYPTGTATRAEVAQIMMNFCENVAK